MQRILLGILFLLCIKPILSKYGPYKPLSGHHTVSLFGIFHNNLPKNNFKVEEFFIFENTQQPLYYALTYFTYGISDKLTFLPSIPLVSRKPANGDGNVTGLGSINLQFNYLLYLQENPEFRYRMIATFGLGLPTTTISQVTLFSLKAINSMIGILQDAMTQNWYFFYDFGLLLISKKGNLKTGNFVIYDFGMGRTFCYNEHYITLMGEFFGLYQQPDHLNGNIVLTTGGNAVYVGPTVRYYHKRCYVHGGILATVAWPSRIPEKPSSYLLGFNAGFYF